MTKAASLSNYWNALFYQNYKKTKVRKRSATVCFLFYLLYICFYVCSICTRYKHTTWKITIISCIFSIRNYVENVETKEHTQRNTKRFQRNDMSFKLTIDNLSWTNI